jgi:hypothetical protein
VLTFIGTSDHGVLGRRWVYDGTHDPVLVAQLLALLQRGAQPQAQSATNTPDSSVTTYFAGVVFPTVVRSTAVANGSQGTHLVVETKAEAELNTESSGHLTIQVTRVLQHDQQDTRTDPTEAQGYVTAGWRMPDDGERRGLFVVLRDAAP